LKRAPAKEPNDPLSGEPQIPRYFELGAPRPTPSSLPLIFCVGLLFSSQTLDVSPVPRSQIPPLKRTLIFFPCTPGDFSSPGFFVPAILSFCLPLVKVCIPFSQTFRNRKVWTPPVVLSVPGELVFAHHEMVSNFALFSYIVGLFFLML